MIFLPQFLDGGRIHVEIEEIVMPFSMAIDLVGQTAAPLIMDFDHFSAAASDPGLDFI